MIKIPNDELVVIQGTENEKFGDRVRVKEEHLYRLQQEFGHFVFKGDCILLRTRQPAYFLIHWSPDNLLVQAEAFLRKKEMAGGLYDPEDLEILNILNSGEASISLGDLCRRGSCLDALTMDEAQFDHLWAAGRSFPNDWKEVEIHILDPDGDMVRVIRWGCYRGENSISE